MMGLWESSQASKKSNEEIEYSSLSESNAEYFSLLKRKVKKEKKKNKKRVEKNYSKTPFNYSRHNFNTNLLLLPIGKPPQFDG